MTVNLNEPIDLAQANLIAQGANRLVYQHPTRETVLIKVPKSSSKDEHKLKTRRINRPALIRYGSLRTMQREQDEYLALMWRNKCLPSFLPRLHGYCETTLGPGALVEKIVDVDGALAPTVMTVYENGGASDQFVARLDAFFEVMMQCGCIAAGIHSRNIVCINDAEQFFLVDGLGEIVLIKTQWMSDGLRRRSLLKQKRAVLAEIGR